jgi:hypothetical protein
MVAGSSPAGRTIQGYSTQIPKVLNATVAVAQSVEPRIVIPVVAGSIPVSHPISPRKNSLKISAPAKAIFCLAYALVIGDQTKVSFNASRKATA